MSAPSVTLLKTWSVLTRWLLAAVLLFWLLFAAGWGVLHWLIVPRIGDYRPQLQARATQALGVPVRLGAVVARSNGLTPSFELSDVELFDAQGRVALRLARVLVSLSPRSLWRLGFEQIYVDQPTLDVRRLPDGKITVAGLDFSGASESNTPALNWFFSQLELVIAQGEVRWTDELRGAAPVALRGVDVVVRNVGRHHDMRLDATPPPQWGDRFSVRGRFVQPLLERQNGRWQRWDGQLFAAFDRVDVAQLQRFVKLGFDLNQGVGALRAWVDVKQARVTGGTADVALSEVSVKLGRELQELALRRVQGRLGLRLLDGGFEFSTQSLAFDTREGLRWPGGNVRYLSVAAAGQPQRGELQADRLDLAALAQIADRLPLQPQWHQRLTRFAPKGRVDSLSANWQGPLDAPTRYSAQGQLRQIEVTAVAAMPGVRALDVDFDLDQSAGRARLSMTGGSVDVPGILQEGRVVVDELSAQASWQHGGDDWSVELADVRFANADAQGQASIKWRTSDPQRSAARSRYPGTLDLQATLTRADARQVHRYLPLVIEQAARDYVRAAIVDGTASNVSFVVKGELDQLPLVDAGQGVFRITVPVSHAKLAFVPRYLQPAAEPPWPVLSDIQGEVVIDRAQLQVKVASAKLGSGGLQVARAQASIADLRHTRVLVDAEFRGPLADALKTVQASPLNDLTAQALADARAGGVADYTLKLMLPIADLDKTTVQGSVRLANNDFQIAATAPGLTHARGLVSYTDKGLSLTGVQGRMLGGDARIDGGLLFASASAEPPRGAPNIRIAGLATADGLRQAAELGFLARLARHVEGSTTYNAVLGLRFGLPELLVTSTLQGLGSTLPEPLRKSPTSSLPLRLQWGLPGSADRKQDRLSLTLDQLAHVVYERDTSQPVSRVLRGSVSVGTDTLGSLSLPARGVNANLHVARLDVDAWSGVLSQLGLVTAPSGARAQSGVDYLPATLALRADSLVFGAREFSQLVVGADREGPLWRANVDATELNGYLEYRPASDAGAASAGRVYARLARLTLAPSAASDMESLMDEQPASIPALDVVVDAFELRGKHLGRLEMEAINRSTPASGSISGVREWRLNKFNLIVPEATLTASGNWARIGAQALPLAETSSATASEQRRTVMNFRLDMRDGGKLLERFGMPGVVRQASGKIEGQAAWVGSPLKPDYPTLGGAFTVNVASGQFLKADPGLAKLLGVLSLQALPRRLTLDFRDVFSEGFAFDFLRGDVTVDQGIARTNNLQMKGINAAVLMDGRANIANETQDLKVVVVPEINAGTASLIATVINPAVGLGTFLAQWLLRRPLMDSATQEFHVDGSWANPRVTKMSATAAPPQENKP